MKFLLRSAAKLYIFFILLHLQACETEIDYDTYPGYTACSINKVIQYGGLYNDTARIAYNTYGNPVSISTSTPRTGHPDHIFKYDDSQRLVQYFQPYENEYFENWHKYGYDGSGRIVWDTVFTFGLRNGNSFPSDYRFKKIHRYSYDAFGRIIRMETTSILPAVPGVTVTHFNYSPAGNLILPGVVYDSKINFHQTHRIWMFLDRDYSRNNPLTATTYNPNLPLTFRHPITSTHYFLTLEIQRSDFHYSCSVPEVVTP